MSENKNATINKNRIEFWRQLKQSVSRIIAPCSFSTKMVKENKLIIEQTASSSFVLLGVLHLRGKIKNKPVVLKVYFPYKDVNVNNSMYMEIYIYAKYVNHMILSRETPHLALMYKNYECDISTTPVLQLSPYIRQLKRSLSNMRENVNDYDTSKLLVLVLEKVPGHNIADYIEKIAPNNKQVIKSLLFQILWTLACFNHYGIRSNDLHLGNILVQPLGSTTYINYFVSANLFYRIKVNPGFIKIIDFERASTKELSNATGKVIDTRAHWNSPNNKYDLFFFLVRIFTISGFPISLKKEILDCCLDVSLLAKKEQTKHGFPDLCHKTKNNKGEVVCGGNSTLNNTQMKTPMQFIDKIYGSKENESTFLFKNNINDILKQKNMKNKKHRSQYFRNIMFFPSIKDEMRKTILEKVK